MLNRISLSPFHQRELENTLLAHADSLAHGRDDADILLSRHSNQRHALAGLFNLARKVRDALAPVEPDATFVAELRAGLARPEAVPGDLVAYDEDLLQENRRLALKIAGVAGLLVSGVAMVALGIHFIISMVSRRRAATPV